MTEEMALVYVDGSDSAMRIVAWDLLRSKLVVKANYLDSCELYLKGGTREKISTSSRTLTLLCKRADVDEVVKALRPEMKAVAVPVLQTRL
jgi:hypothetical protein